MFVTVGICLLVGGVDEAGDAKGVDFFLRYNYFLPGVLCFFFVLFFFSPCVCVMVCMFCGNRMNAKLGCVCGIVCLFCGTKMNTKLGCVCV